MIEPEIALADLSDNAALAEALLKYTFAALLERDRRTSLSSTSGSRRGWSRNSKGSSVRGLCIWIMAKRSKCSGAREREIRVPGRVGHRPAVGAPALSDREIREKASHRDELPEGHQGLLHAADRPRPNRRGDGRAVPEDRRDHRWQPARGAARSIGPQYGRARHRPDLSGFSVEGHLVRATFTDNGRPTYRDGSGNAADRPKSLHIALHGAGTRRPFGEMPPMRPSASIAGSSPGTVDGAPDR